MLASGDWLTPRLNGIKYFEKPPLQYWTTAAAYRLFGRHAWTARLWTALAGFLTIAVVWWAGRRLLGPAAGDYAALVLASNVYFVVLGHVNSLDMGLTLFTTLALLGFCLAQRGGRPAAEQRRWMLVTWAAMAFAVLSKGLIGLVLPGGTLLSYCLLAHDWTAWRRLHLVPGGLLFLAIAAPWFIAVSVVNPEFPWFFFMEQHVLRYATDAGRREAPVYYFAGVLAAGMLPWTLLMLDALWAEARARWRRMPAERAALVLLAWIAVVFLFFSASRSKLPSYVLPIFPALALLMGKRIAELSPSALLWRVLPVGLLACAAPILVANAPRFANDPVLRPLVERYTYWLYAALVLTLAGVVYCWRQAAAGRKLAAVTGFSLAALVANLLVLNGHDSFAPSLSSYAIAQRLRAVVPAGVPFYSVRTYDQTLPFYLERTFTLVEFRDELDYGLRQQPELAIHDLQEFRARWAAQARAYAVTTPEQYELLRREGFPMQLVAEDGRRVVVKKPDSS